MKAAKQDALNTIEQLPENADMEEIMYRLYVLDKVRKGQEAMEQGEVLTSDGVILNAEELGFMVPSDGWISVSVSR